MYYLTVTAPDGSDFGEYLTYNGRWGSPQKEYLMDTCWNAEAVLREAAGADEDWELYDSRLIQDDGIPYVCFRLEGETERYALVPPDGSNADLPIVGGSILSHDHFQGGHYTFAMERAPVEEPVRFRGFDDIRAGIVKWPMSVLRLTGPDSDRLVELADRILRAWRGYTDESAFVFAETDGEPHNTITPIARRRRAGPHRQRDDPLQRFRHGDARICRADRLRRAG